MVPPIIVVRQRLTIKTTKGVKHAEPVRERGQGLSASLARGGGWPRLLMER
jgi:hypothetical protein